MYFVLAQAQPGPPPTDAAPPGGGLMGLLLPMAVILLIWWFLVLRPQGKADKARRAKLAAIQKGDKVRTRGGIEGVVVRVQDDRVIVKVDLEGKVHVAFAKTYIDEVLSDEPAPATKEP